MNKRDGTPSPILQRPAKDDKEAWKAYWKEQGQEWRTEPEIDVERQKYLDARRSIKPDIEQSILPFKDIKLNRADIEWLLATHENGRGPVDWNDESQREREGLDLRGANLGQVDLHLLPLTRLRGGLPWEEWFQVTEEQRKMATVLMKGANLEGARLQGANLGGARLQGANLGGAQLQGAYLGIARLQRVNLFQAQLQRASLRAADLSGAGLGGVVLGNKQRIGPRLADVHWGDTNLTILDWSLVSRLGDEWEAQQKQTSQGEVKGKRLRLNEFRAAVRANRQLAVVLRNQGLNEDAARFAYRAQLMQRKMLWHQGVRSLGQYFFSFFLDLLAGYGYKPWRSFLAYLLVIGIFAALYYHLSAHLAWNEAIVISMTAFHGRGFFPDQFHPGDPQALVAALEAFVGLLIEVTFIATLTQRLFGK
jgi:uncharacterized protein YjbI with pentapeptide repeats